MLISEKTFVLNILEFISKLLLREFEELKNLINFFTKVSKKLQSSNL